MYEYKKCDWTYLIMNYIFTEEEEKLVMAGRQVCCKITSTKGMSKYRPDRPASQLYRSGTCHKQHGTAENQIIDCVWIV